ncbi:MAG TPA: tRNA (adenosine(37)-N6)-threonylcarbamoyltransferase complex transferase subunit TsaD [Alphaproteobacteria bacterium]|nr:tRNA (adenosine(37)-N6)-threonylcarbamoyltransferase complex transferase subunit TsaD [Alphaproteobacteria bacterium]HQS94623.1 tRNA (adenosine(37)-N6)-threonylcarbamoyltransferase complex transferase subunit TsaD [Alphaproteobacteria bacterium]
MSSSPLIMLGIETSCDETSIAIVSEDRRILSNQIYTQQKDHVSFGGVVPELAARAHLERLPILLKEALQEADLVLQDLSGIAVTGGPGLMGGVLMGVLYAKAIAATLHKPFLAINHLEAHALTIRLTEEIPFPYLLLLVSGGHTQFLWTEGIGRYKLLGASLDDAAGEAFDKIAKLLNLGYPGGPALEKSARLGNPERFDLPRPLLRTPHCNFSFSGLKTAVLKKVEALPHPLTLQDKNDMAASFQKAVGDTLIDRCQNAFKVCKAFKSSFPFVVAGGVASNLYLKQKLELLANEHHLPLKVPPLKLCTDNGAMVAWAGIERLKQGLEDSLDFSPRPRWPLEDLFNAKTNCKKVTD